MKSTARGTACTLRALVITLALLVPLAQTAVAHELRPAYLELREFETGEFSVLWKTPMLGELRLALEPEFGGSVKAITPVTTRRADGAAIQEWTLRGHALRGQTLRIRGLESTMTDVLTRIAFADGSSWTGRLTPAMPVLTIPARSSALGVAAVYLELGMEHILFGVDHLVFVLGLLLLIDNHWMLLKTITAFTVAHSVTLGIATLGYATVPVAPVEASIALSICFLGPEIVRKWRGGSSLTIRQPWLVAFCFGLLHGFGFSSALTSAGIPRTDLPLALLCFNIGVEFGQVGFVGLIVLLGHWFRRARVRWPVWVTRAPGYAVGTIGAFWTIQRTVAMFKGL